MPTRSTDTGPTNPEPTRDLTSTELDDLNWDIAVGRPTRVVLDTASKRDTASAVCRKINDALAGSHIIEPVE